MVVLDPLVARHAHDAVAALALRVTVRAAFVFGSRAMGGGDRWSDLDVAVFVDGIEGWSLEQRVKLISAVQAQVDDEVELHLFPAKFLDNPPPAGLAQLVVREGVPVDVNAVSERGE